MSSRTRRSRLWDSLCAIVRSFRRRDAASTIAARGPAKVFVSDGMIPASKGTVARTCAATCGGITIKGNRPAKNGPPETAVSQDGQQGPERRTLPLSRRCNNKIGLPSSRRTSMQASRFYQVGMGQSTGEVRQITRYVSYTTTYRPAAAATSLLGLRGRRSCCEFR
jgi:hypothetical protein